MPPSKAEGAAAWLHALWGRAAAVAALKNGARPILSGRGPEDRVLHLPPGGRRAWERAACAHAAAHWRFGAPAQARAALKPVQQALFGVLEDARVETRALGELPGLRALWLPFHAGPDAPAGNGFEDLLARLARCLIDAAHEDRHPWVVRACTAFLACDGTPEAVRLLASRLGNDIGQMRLPFNARTYAVHAAYRDDGSWLWERDEELPASQTPLAADADGKGAADDTQDVAPEGPPTAYPEWDARIGRYRAGWCSVYMRAAEHATASRLLPAAAPGEVARVLAALPPGPPANAGRAAWGEEFDPMALLDTRLQRLAGQPPDLRVFRRRTTLPPRRAVQLLVDASASTGEPAGTTWLDRGLALALATAARLEAGGHACAIAAFASRTRERVELRVLKHWQERTASAEVTARACALRPGGSTRSGAALRHAAALAREQARQDAGSSPAVLLFTDGEPHDVDVPDASYLRADLRRAIAEAERRGIAVRCVGPAAFLQWGA